MSDIVQMTGNVKYPITLDPSVWIFDDRKIELEKCFDKKSEDTNQLEEYTKAMSRKWEKERSQGVSFPPVNRNLNRTEKEQALSRSFVMPFRPFIDHAVPAKEVQNVEIIQKNGKKTTISFHKVKQSFLCFSHNGKPLKEDGPLHLYFADGSNRHKPIKNITAFSFL